MYADDDTRPYVLFDLDGTLIRPGSALQRAHMAAMERAICETSGSSEAFRYRGGDLHYAHINLSGFTDAGTIEAALKIAGVPRPDLSAARERTVASMLRHLMTGTGERAGGAGDALPGAVHTVRSLAVAGIRVGLSTGNARAVAMWKLARIGLDDVLRSGGFGDTACDRDTVVAQGLTAFGEVRESGVVVGDTAKDVSAAHANGLRCIAVATGGASAETLREAGADDVLTDLNQPDTVRVITAIAHGYALGA
ncbi:HAD family hydrolase [Streptomyces sp. NPDC056796]|uniref:HAD family hydrolase n=1 Tax=Streptomyces sp. NPDC056796 TaxID=3345947 RepID=UPI0036B1BE5D